MFHLPMCGMRILRCASTAKTIGELAARAEWELLFLSPGAAKTKKGLEAAFLLAKEAFADGTNVSDGVAKEALLFLANEMNFSSALKKVGAASAKDFLLVSEKNLPVAKLKKELKLVKMKKISLPEWGKKIGGYFEAELAIEKMALARVKN